MYPQEKSPKHNAPELKRTRRFFLIVCIYQRVNKRLENTINFAYYVIMTGRKENFIDLVKDIELGPVMRELNERQRNFVYAMIETGGMNFSLAAREAGYSGDVDSLKSTAYRLAHDTKIQEAIREMAPRLLTAGSIIAAKFVLETINNPGVETKDRLKAAEMVMNRTGLHATSEHKVAVTTRNESGAELIKQITLMSKQLGIDPQKLLGNNAVIEDAVFEEVKPFDENSIEDLL